MREAEHLADAIKGLLSNNGHRWFTAFLATMAGLSNHMRFWFQVVLRSMCGQPVDKNAMGRPRLDRRPAIG